MGKTQNTSITVNGVAKVWTKSTVTYDDLLILAGLSGKRKVKYALKVNNLTTRSGHVNAKTPINIAQGMAFTVT